MAERWFVVNAREAGWESIEGSGRWCTFEGDARFEEYGINIHVLLPGEPSCMYHGENAQEDFLVLSGECLLVIEGEERRLRQWDFVHCPPWTRHVFVGAGSFGSDPDLGLLHKGWGIPTATDIALAWLVARAVFGAGHPAINFLLLLAVADDGIGLVIIAAFYGDPTNPAKPIWLLLCLLGVAVALALRKARVRSWVPYVALGGPLAWCGLMLAHMHPALAWSSSCPACPGPSATRACSAW